MVESWVGMAGVRRVASPNKRARRGEEELRLVVIHATWMAGDDKALARLCDPAAEVSCHYYISRAGEVIQLVDEAEVAFHAGKSVWQGIEGVNGWSLGIELANSGPFGSYPDGPPVGVEQSGVDWGKVEAFSEAQYGALIGLLRDILRRHPQIRPAAVVGHEEVSVGRKIDPGGHFDWGRLVSAGVCVR